MFAGRDRRWPSWLRCPEWIWPEMKAYDRGGELYRCHRGRWHRDTHRDPYGDSWEGERR